MALVLPIINSCNQNCQFCSAAGRVEKIDLKNFFDLIDGEKESIEISGGEPILSEDLVRIIKHIKQHSLFCELQTNGVLLSDIELVRKLMGAKVDLFNVNFPSHLPKIADDLTRTPGYHKYRLAGILNLLKLGANVRLTHVITRQNYRYLLAYVDFVAKKLSSIKFIQFSFVKGIGRAAIDIKQIPSYKSVSPFLKKALASCQKNSISFIVDHIPMCFLGNFAESHIDYKKIVSGFGQRYAAKEKQKIAQCRNCRYFDSCSGVRVDHLSAFGDRIFK